MGSKDGSKIDWSKIPEIPDYEKYGLMVDIWDHLIRNCSNFIKEKNMAGYTFQVADLLCPIQGDRLQNCYAKNKDKNEKELQTECFEEMKALKVCAAERDTNQASEGIANVFTTLEDTFYKPCKSYVEQLEKECQGSRTSEKCDKAFYDFSVCNYESLDPKAANSLKECMKGVPLDKNYSDGKCKAHFDKMINTHTRFRHHVYTTSIHGLNVPDWQEFIGQLYDLEETKEGQ